LARDLPRLVYVREPAPRRDPRLADLLAGASADHTVGYRRFGDPDELRDLVERDLAVLLSATFEQNAEPAPADTGTRLPVSRTPLVGREDDVDAVSALVEDEAVRLVTLVGPGGIGKTRLATAVAERTGGGFPDGVRYVDLSSVTVANLVGEALARGLGVRTSGAVRPEVDVVARLRTQRVLLVVDNFEQLTDAAPVLGAILRGAPDVTALVTSRAPLRLAAERVYELAPLTADTGTPAESPGVRLFADAARAAAPGFRLTPANTDAVVEIVRRLDGLPLAIVLAAARVRLLPPAAIVERLGDPLRLLTGGARDLPDRQRTLRDTIAWSYRLLGPAEQRLFDCLGVFAGGWDIEAVEAVTGTDPLPALEALVEAALIRREDVASGQARFAMLDTIRHYARTRLRDGGRWHSVHTAYAAYYGAMAEGAEVDLNRAGTGAVWLDRLELEHDNLNAALDWFHEQDDPAAALRAMWATWTFWWRRGHFDEARRHVAAILDRGGRLDAAGQGRALLVGGGAEYVSGQFDAAEALLVRGLPLLRAAGDPGSLALALCTLAQFAARRGEREVAQAQLTEATGLISGAAAWQASLVHSRVALVAVEDGRYADALAALRVALDVSAAAEEQLAALVAHYTWALAATGLGEHGEAREHLVHGLELAAVARDEAVASAFLAAIADLDGRDGYLDRAVRLDSASRAWQTPSGEAWMRAFVAPWPGARLDRTAARAQLGDEAFDRACRVGEHLSLAEAAAEAAGGR
ncbi:ATP-binding protein, partial [Asanoa siamensis]|uniref:ATP-binding protein n=1 Tax=Asanoa siamensis TaxID=926357 RepID=UPI001EF353C0